MKVKSAIRLLHELTRADKVNAKHTAAIEYAINELRQRNRAADFFNALRGPGADYDNAVLTFEKLIAEYAPAATGEDILEIIGRAYFSARARGTLGALVDRGGGPWKESDR